MQIATIEIQINYLLKIRSPESVLPGEIRIIDTDKGFKIVLHAAVIIGQLLIPGAIDSGSKGHDLSPPRTSCRHYLERPFYLLRHPVFKDRPVNIDPREAFIRDLFWRRDEYNIFHEYFGALVQALFDGGVSRNVYCVNIDAVIAALLLKMFWKPFIDGKYPAAALETAAFTVFLYPRLLGCAAEIDDRMNRGRGMDTRTPASQCRFVV